MRADQDQLTRRNFLKTSAAAVAVLTSPAIRSGNLFAAENSETLRAGLVEQAVHGVDKIAWAMKDAKPLKAVAVGGRQTPNHEGNIYDHIFVVYDFPNDVRAFMGQRQVNNCYSEVSDTLLVTEGIAQIPGRSEPLIRGMDPGALSWGKDEHVSARARRTFRQHPLRPTHQ